MWPDDTAYAACDEAKATKRMLILSVRTAASKSILETKCFAIGGSLQ